jgi:hypothetical protein
MIALTIEMIPHSHHHRAQQYCISLFAALKCRQVQCSLLLTYCLISCTVGLLLSLVTVELRLSSHGGSAFL